MGTTPLKLISGKSLNLTFKVTYVTPCIFSTSELNKQQLQSSVLDGGVVVVVVVVVGGGGGGGRGGRGGRGICDGDNGD